MVCLIQCLLQALILCPVCPVCPEDPEVREEEALLPVVDFPVVDFPVAPVVNSREMVDSPELRK